ncbi:MAG: hypothetical protein KF829_09760 [Ferruginibacter sp.]|nr:hypothetical protein [Ferruginibacter sp.]
MNKRFTNTFFILFACCTISTLVQGQTNRVDVAKSIVNISAINGGGTFKPGDTIEIRTTIAVMRQASTRTIIDQVSVKDVIPTNTTYIINSMRVATNEGLTYKGPFTDGLDGDAGTRSGSNITINLGNLATGTSGGRIRSDSSRPSFYGSTCIMVASFRVRINPSAPYGTTITTGGKISYRMVSPTPVSNYNIDFPAYNILLFEEEEACTNGLGVSAASDAQGTFGKGTVKDRVAPLAFATTYTKQTLSANEPQDYNYSIVNNSSVTGSTNPAIGVPNAARVFTLWDINGDHTGAVNPTIGNLPVAPGTEGGYMVLVNASYKTDTAYRETLSNLCPNTYYQFSAWIKNICPRCSCDSTGKGSGSGGFLPAAGNDSSGVKPNISFEIDGKIYYSSGDIKYNRASPWKKYGFTFLTGPTQTTADFLIRNNSPGGGGNDWALDDIVISHCGPSLAMNYAPIALGCTADPFEVRLSDTVRYKFNNSYIHFKWQISNVGGTVWTDMTGPGTRGVGVPSIVNGQYQYVTNLPPFLAYPADSGRYFRVYVATTASNLDNDCAYTDGSVRMISVINCGLVLSSKFIIFKGSLINNTGYLHWTTEEMESLSHYIIEKSSDAINFRPIGNINAHNTHSAGYFFIDPEIVSGRAYYRLKMYSTRGVYKYSHIVSMGLSLNFNITHIENPINNLLSFDVSLPNDGQFYYSISNNNGQTILKGKELLQKGINRITYNIDHKLAPGLYYLSGWFGNERIHKKIIKAN